MTIEMSHRERALSALNHKEGDRIPLDLGATRNSGIHYLAYKELIRYLGFDEIDIMRDDFGLSKVVGIARPSESVLERFGIDFRGVFLGEADKTRECMLPNGDWCDELGIVRRQPPGSIYWDVVESPFADEYSIHDILKYPWPNPMDPGYIRGLRSRAMQIREHIDCALVLHLHDIVVHQTQFLLGFEKWFTSFMIETNKFCALLDAVLDFRLGVTIQALDAVGDLVDVVSCSDDVADQRRSLVSPDMYRKFIKPRHLRFFDVIRERTKAKILFHSCGAVRPLLNDFIDIGIDFINPVQVSADGMDSYELKRDFGDKIGFWGGIDTQVVLPQGTPEQVKSEVHHRINDLAPGGGYVLAAVHNIQPDVPPENIVAMYDSACSLGKYPLVSSGLY